VDYDREDAAQDESRDEASLSQQHQQHHLAPPASAGWARAVYRNYNITKLGCASKKFIQYHLNSY